MLKWLSLKTTCPKGLQHARAIYGGVGVSMGLIFLFCALIPSALSAGTYFMAVTYLGAILARGGSMHVNNVDDVNIRNIFMIESSGFIMSIMGICLIGAGDRGSRITHATTTLLPSIVLACYGVWILYLASLTLFFGSNFLLKSISLDTISTAGVAEICALFGGFAASVGVAFLFCAIVPDATKIGLCFMGCLNAGVVAVRLDTVLNKGGAALDNKMWRALYTECFWILCYFIGLVTLAIF